MTPRLCGRAGCSAPAAATLRFQPTRREAWLVDLDAHGPRTEGDLCTRHASALVLPRGWALHDRRASPAASRGELGEGHDRDDRDDHDDREEGVRAGDERNGRQRAVATPPVGGTRRRQPRVRTRRAETTPDDARAQADALTRVPDARTPLLRRAFGNVAAGDVPPPPQVTPRDDDLQQQPAD